jgi:hypothetical protein
MNATYSISSPTWLELGGTTKPRWNIFGRIKN